MKDILIEELNKIITMLVNKEYEKFAEVIHCQDLNSSDILNIIEDFGETLIIPEFKELEQLNIIDIEESEWAIDFNLWTKESGKSDLTLQLIVKKNLDSSLNIELDDIHVL